MPTDNKLFMAFAAAFVAANVLTAAALLLFFGWKIYKVFVSLMTGCALALVGWFFLAQYLPEKYRFIAPLVLGAAGIAVAIPLQRVVTFAITGALGAVIAAAVATHFYNLPFDFNSTPFLIAVGSAFIVTGALGAIFFRFLIVFITSAYGGGLAVSGALLVMLACLNQLPQIATDKTSKLSLSTVAPLDRNIFLGTMVTWGAVTIIGMVYQYRTMESPKKKSKTAAKDKPKAKK